MEKELKQEKVSKLLLILILTYGTVISAVTAASMLLTLMVLRIFQRSLTDLEPLYLTLFIIITVSFIHKNNQIWALDGCIELDKCTQISFSFFLVKQFIENRDSNSTVIVLFNPDNLIQLLKNSGCVMGGCVSLGFFSTSKKRRDVT